MKSIEQALFDAIRETPNQFGYRQMIPNHEIKYMEHGDAFYIFKQKAAHEFANAIICKISVQDIQHHEDAIVLTNEFYCFTRAELEKFVLDIFKDCRA